MQYHNLIYQINCKECSQTYISLRSTNIKIKIESQFKIEIKTIAAVPIIYTITNHVTDFENIKILHKRVKKCKWNIVNQYIYKLCRNSNMTLNT